MRTIFLLLTLILPIQLQSGQTVAVSAGGKLTVFGVKGEALSVLQTHDLHGSSGPMGESPDGKFLYVNTRMPDETKTLAISTFSISEDGTLNLVNTAPSPWTSGCLRPDATGKFLAGNSYRDGKVGIWTLADDGVYRGAPACEFELEKKAHSAVFSPDNRFLYVPATNPNKVFQLVFNAETGAVHPNQPSSAPGFAGEEDAQHPRHLVFHPTIDFAYTTQESSFPGAAVWSFDREKGLLECIQTIASIGMEKDGVSTADLHLSKDGRFLFVSNRDGKNKKEPVGRDSITVFQVDQTTGKLTFVEREPCQRVPRSFAIGNEGKLLFVSGQGDSKLGVYRINQETGHLTRNEVSYDLPGSPRWVSVLNAK